MQFHFSNHVLDVDLRELTRAGEPIAVEPQVFDLLIYLVENRDHVVSKDDLIEKIWDGRIVSESTLTSRINAARKAVGDSGHDQGVIRTIARKGLSLRRRRARAVQRRGRGHAAAASGALRHRSPPPSRRARIFRRSIARRSRCCRSPT